MENNFINMNMKKIKIALLPICLLSGLFLVLDGYALAKSCDSAADCDDGDPCTKNICWVSSKICYNPDIPNCGAVATPPPSGGCTNDTQCNDLNPCTLDWCTNVSGTRECKNQFIPSYCPTPTPTPTGPTGDSGLGEACSSSSDCVGSHTHCSGSRCVCNLDYDSCNSIGEDPDGCECYTGSGAYRCDMHGYPVPWNQCSWILGGGGSCTEPDNGCAANTCTTAPDCWDGCDWVAGTKDCPATSTPTPTIIPTATATPTPGSWQEVIP